MWCVWDPCLQLNCKMDYYLKKESHIHGMAWGWVNEESIFGLSIPLISDVIWWHIHENDRSARQSRMKKLWQMIQLHIKVYERMKHRHILLTDQKTDHTRAGTAIASEDAIIIPLIAADHRKKQELQ